MDYTGVDFGYAVGKYSVRGRLKWISLYLDLCRSMKYFPLRYPHVLTDNYFWTYLQDILIKVNQPQDVDAHVCIL